MIEEVRLDYPVHLQVLEMVRDALEKPLANVRVVRSGICFPIMQGVAALRAAAVRNAWPVVLIIGVADREFAAKRMVNSEKPSSHMNLIIVV